MIPVHQPQIGARELELVTEALRDSEISGSAGQFIPRFERMFAEFCGTKHAVSVSSGSTALHLAVSALNIGPGDEVLVSAATNIASANAVALCGATVVPVDVRPDTWCMDVDVAERMVSQKTKAIMPVHLYGHPVDMTAVLRLAEKYDLKVIEDCAEAHGAEWYGHRVGSFGDFGCFSFYANKIITTGEGGMLTTNDDALADKARSLRNLAFGTPRFWHTAIGFNYRLTNMQAAVGVAQMERIHQILARKRAIAAGYLARLRHVPGLRLPVEQLNVCNVYWMFALVTEPEYGSSRDELMRVLSEAGIESRTMFCPMNLQPALKDHSVEASCPVAEDLWHNGLYLPSGCGLTEDDLDCVCHVVTSCAKVMT